MNRKEVLEAARHCVCGEREQDYGRPENNFARIAALWEAYNGHKYKPEDVAIMMALLKIARIASGRKADNYVDLAGYAALAGELAAEEDQTEEDQPEEDQPEEDQSTNADQPEEDQTEDGHNDAGHNDAGTVSVRVRVTTDPPLTESQKKALEEVVDLAIFRYLVDEELRHYGN